MSCYCTFPKLSTGKFLWSCYSSADEVTYWLGFRSDKLTFFSSYSWLVDVPVSHLTLSRSQSSLLSTNWQLALTHVPRINTRQVPNTGTLLLRQPKQQSEKVGTCMVTCYCPSLYISLSSTWDSGKMAIVKAFVDASKQVFFCDSFLQPAW